MSDIKELIRENNRNARKSRLINNILWGIVIILVGVSFYTSFDAILAKKAAEESDRAKQVAILAQKKALKEKNASLKLADSLVKQLKLSEEDLQMEKDKLELFKVKYDSIRELTLNQTDDLWEYAKRENTIESYTDYVNIKGVNEEVANNIKSLLKRTGFMQIQESNGNMLIQAYHIDLGLWITKSARSVRNGVIGNPKYSNQSRTGDVILKGQPFVILEDNIMSGKARWAKIAY